MARFAILYRYTSETWKSLVAAPEDRTKAVAATFEAAGGTLLSMHYMLGPHDGLVVVDLPGATSVAAVSVLVAASGAYASVETHALLEPAELVEALGTAGRVAGSFVAPGAAS